MSICGEAYGLAHLFSGLRRQNNGNRGTNKTRYKSVLSPRCPGGRLRRGTAPVAKSFIREHDHKLGKRKAQLKAVE